MKIAKIISKKNMSKIENSLRRKKTMGYISLTVLVSMFLYFVLGSKKKRVA